MCILPILHSVSHGKCRQGDKGRIALGIHGNSTVYCTMENWHYELAYFTFKFCAVSSITKVTLFACACVASIGNDAVCIFITHVHTTFINICRERNPMLKTCTYPWSLHTGRLKANSLFLSYEMQLKFCRRIHLAGHDGHTINAATGEWPF